MRVHVLFVAVVLALVTGWVVVQRRGPGADPDAARDRLVAQDNVVATFVTENVEGYTFTRLHNGTWTWDRTFLDGTHAPGALLYNGRQYLLEIAGGCYIDLPQVRDPLIPGVTVARKLKGLAGVTHESATTVHYRVDPGSTAVNAIAGPAAIVDVAEDLSPLERNEGYRAVTSGSSGSVWYGSYVVRAATAAEADEAATRIREAAASPYASLRVQLRVVGTEVGGRVVGPYPIVVARDCPGSPGQVWPSAQGGQGGGLRVTPSPIRFTAATTPVVAGAKLLRSPLAVSSDALAVVAAEGTFGDVPLSVGAVYVVSDGMGAMLAIEVLSCSGRPFFVC